MSHPAPFIDADTLRQQLMAPNPMQRVAALHLLEVEAECGAGAGDERAALAQAVTRFVARGIPFYAVHDPHYQAWVGKAVDYWLRLRQATLVPAARPRSGAAQRV